MPRRFPRKATTTDDLPRTFIERSALLREMDLDDMPLDLPKPIDYGLLSIIDEYTFPPGWMITIDLIDLYIFYAIDEEHFRSDFVAETLSKDGMFREVLDYAVQVGWLSQKERAAAHVYSCIWCDDEDCIGLCQCD